MADVVGLEEDAPVGQVIFRVVEEDVIFLRLFANAVLVQTRCLVER